MAVSFISIWAVSCCNFCFLSPRIISYWVYNYLLIVMQTNEANISIQVLSDSITDEDGIEDDGDEVWPFHSFVEQLILDMFDPGKL